MAGGKIGDLWWELGLRDKSSKELNKVLKEVQKLDGMINKINKEISEGDDSKKKALTNALSYLRMLQQIANEERKIKDLKRLSAGVDTSELNKALKLLSDFRRQLIDLQSGGAKGGGGVDNAFISGFQKAFGNTLADVKEIERVFKSANSLSVFRNNASRLTNELEKVKNRLAEIYSMQSKGMKNGWDTSMLLGAGNSLRGVKKRIESILRDNSRLSSESEVKKLLSDIQIAYTKVRGKVAEYNREKQRSIELERKHKAEIDSNFAAIDRLAKGFEKVNSSAGGMRGPLNDIKNLLLQGGIVYGMQSFLRSIVQTGGEIEQQHIALRSILGDRAKADELFAQTKQLALESPFKFGELNRDVKQLAAFGVEANNIYETTKRLADIASGLGVDFGRIGLAFGQVKARAWLDGKELRQFAYAGLPLLQKITELYNKEGKNGRNNYTTGDVKKMISNREVSFDDVKKVLWQLTDEGGQFYNMQFVLSETLLGRYNKLIDAWDIMLGKFADGKNVIGSVMKYSIDRVTDLVLALDKLSPAILGFGAAFAAKRIAMAGSSLVGKAGLGSELSILKATQIEELKLYAVEQQRLVAKGAISQKEANSLVMKRAYLLAESQSTSNAITQLALQGKLNILQLQRAYREKMISPELVKELELMGLISNKQSELIMKSGRLARLQAGANMIGSKIGSFFSFGNIAMLGAGVGLALWQGYSQYRSKIKEEADNIAQSAADHLKSLAEVYKETSEMATGSELEQQVDKMKDVLEQSGYYTDSIKEQIEYAKTLQDEYSILKNRILEAKQASSVEEKYAGAIAEAKSASGRGFGVRGPVGWVLGLFNDSFDTNVNDVSDVYGRLQLRMEKFSDTTKKKMNEVADSILGPKAAAMSLEEKLGELSINLNGEWIYFESQMLKSNSNIKGDLDGLSDVLRSFGVNMKEITQDDLPKMMEALAREKNMELDEFAQWAEQHPRTFKAMLDKMLSEANSKVPGIVSRLREVAYSILNIASPQEPKPTGNKPYKSGLKEGSPAKIIRNRMNKGSFSYRTDIDPMMRMLDAGDWETFGENIRNKYKEERNEIDARKAAKVAYNDRKLRLLEAIANEAGVSLDVGKNRVTGNYGKSGKSDEELKRLRDRLGAFKNARQTYQKYRQIMGISAAMEETERLFPGMSGLNLDDYEGSVKALLKGFDGDASDERRKFISDTNKEIAEWRFSEIMKPEFERLRQDFTEALEDGARQADLYEALFAKTGDKSFAMNAFAGGMLWDDLSSSLADEFRQMTGKDITPFLDQSDAVVKKNLVTDMGLPDAYELWKKISVIVKDNYKKYLEDAAEVIKSTANWEEKIAQARSKYASRIRMANQAGDAETARRYTQQMEQEVSRIRSEKFEQSQDYLNFFGSIITMGAERAMALVPEIIENLNRKLKDGSISAREYAKQMKQVDEQMAKLRVPRRTFLNSGIEGVAQRNIDEGYEKISKGATDKQKAEEMMREGIIKGDAELQAAAVALKNAADKLIEAGKTQMSIGENLKKSFSSLEGAFNYVDNVWGGVSGAFSQFKGMADSLGIDTSKGGWAKASTYIDSIGSITSGASSAIRSVFKGDLGGIVTGAASVITGPITTFAKAHDARKEREIRLAQEQIDILQGIKSNVSSIIDRALGGAYNYKRSESTQRTLNDVIKRYGNQTIWEKAGGRHYYSDETYEAATNAIGNMSAYNDQLAAMYAQRDLIQHQRDSEESKKKKDSSKIRDYNDKLEEMDNSIKDFSQDFLKSIYNVDFKSWASQLTDAVVGAWEKGEDAVEAYHDKAKSLVGDLTKNIITQNIMERALQPALDYLTKELENKNGLLDESSIVGLGKLLEEAGDKSIANITSVLELLKKNGWDLSAESSGNTNNSVKSITEDTGGLLASYLNSIRLDVSVNRDNIQLIADSMQSLTDMNIISKSQLTSLNQLVDLAVYRNGVLDDMYGWMRKVSMGTERVCVK